MRAAGALDQRATGGTTGTGYSSTGRFLPFVRPLLPATRGGRASTGSGRRTDWTRTSMRPPQPNSSASASSRRRWILRRIRSTNPGRGSSRRRPSSRTGGPVSSSTSRTRALVRSSTGLRRLPEQVAGTPRRRLQRPDFGVFRCASSERSVFVRTGRHTLAPAIPIDAEPGPQVTSGRTTIRRRGDRTRKPPESAPRQSAAGRSPGPV